jgi:hypothetical protein
MAAPHGGARQVDVKAAVDEINRQRRELEDQFRRKRTLVLQVINARAAADSVRRSAEEKALAAAEREREAGRVRAMRHERRARAGLRELRRVCASAEEVATLVGIGVGQVRSVVAEESRLESENGSGTEDESGCGSIPVVGGAAAAGDALPDAIHDDGELEQGHEDPAARSGPVGPAGTVTDADSGPTADPDSAVRPGNATQHGSIDISSAGRPRL